MPIATSWNLWRRDSVGLLVFTILITLLNVVLFAVAKARAHRLAVIVEPATQRATTIARGQPVDLSDYCNYHTTNSTLVPRNTNYVNNLAALPLGTTNYAGVRFNVGGIIQLASRESANWNPPHPAKVTGIAVSRKCRKIHILHGTGFWAPDGLPAAFTVRWTPSSTGAFSYCSSSRSMGFGG